LVTYTEMEPEMLSHPDSALLKTEFVNGQYTIYLPPVLTVIEAMTLRQACAEGFAQYSHLSTLILDCSDTHFIDSSGIGALVICRRLCQQQHAELWLQAVGPQIMVALTMTDLDKVLNIRQKEPIEVIPMERAAELVPMTHPSLRSRAKRAVDIAGGLIGLSITGILFVPIAIAILIDDPGPIFFSQIRCSWMGRRFRIWKFRSMVVNAEALKSKVKNEVEGPLFKNENDPRVTRVGRFLRKTSLDEFPQFWNVLKGDMSLVGTRPPTPAELEKYEVPAWQRLNVKPGLTGEWQVNGRSNIKKFEDVIRLDMKYQENWSLMYDLQLIVKTVLVLFSKDAGAS
jgi:anti-anti-sigma factor